MSDINKRSDFEEELETLLNKHGKDADLSVPDFWLADFINSMLEELVNVVVHHPRDEDHFSSDDYNEREDVFSAGEVSVKISVKTDEAKSELRRLIALSQELNIELGDLTRKLD